MKTSLKLSHKIGMMLFVCICAVGALYMLVISKINTKVEAEQASYRELKSQYSDLEAYVSNQVSYQNTTKDNYRTASEVVNTYFPSLTKKEILTYIQWLSSKYKLETSAVTISDVEQVVEFTSDNPDYPMSGVGECASVSLSYSIPYNNLKSYLTSLTEKDTKIALTSISISLDSSTGNVTGLLNVTMHAIEGSTRGALAEVEEATVGVDSLFGTTTKKTSKWSK